MKRERRGKAKWNVEKKFHVRKGRKKPVGKGHGAGGYRIVAFTCNSRVQKKSCSLILMLDVMASPMQANVQDSHARTGTSTAAWSPAVDYLAHTGAEFCTHLHGLLVLQSIMHRFAQTYLGTLHQANTREPLGVCHAHWHPSVPPHAPEFCVLCRSAPLTASWRTWRRRLSPSVLTKQRINQPATKNHSSCRLASQIASWRTWMTRLSPLRAHALQARRPTSRSS
eukprot:scaffold105362_cov21-Tisochrysis_lutea.AAC.3